MEVPEPNGNTQQEKEGKKAKKQIQLERTRTAFERLQLAWIRTGLTLLAIGVGAYEYYFNRIEAGKSPLLKHITGRELALFFIFTAFTMVLLATLQHRKNTALLKQQYPEMQYSVALLLSYIMLAITFFLGWLVIIKL